jgi:hypothetical protein
MVFATTSVWCFVDLEMGIKKKATAPVIIDGIVC